MSKWTSRVPIGAIALPIVGMALLLVLLGPVADWFSDDLGLRGKERADVIDAARRTLLQGAAGLLAVVALAYTGRTYLLAREGQLTDRYTKAVEQLGADALSQRVGGVFALERVMWESKGDHWAVAEVLAALIRERSAASSDGGITRQRDVQAALTVLGRRPHEDKRELDRLRLGHAKLTKTLLRGGRLDGASLRYAQLDGARWEDASLIGTKFRGAVMTGACFEGAVLRNAGLQETDLSEVNFTRTDLLAANLTGATMNGAHLSGVLGNPVLSDAQLKAVHCRPGECCHRNWSAFTG
jgi:hypothetical protein